MEQLLVYLLPLFVLLNLGLLIWSIRLARRNPGMLPRLLLLLAFSGLLDNAILSAGFFLAESPGLEALNRLRYILNALVTPLLIWVAFKLVQSSGSRWAARPGAANGVKLLSLFIMLTWLVISLLLVLKPVKLGGMLRYNLDPARTPGWLTVMDLLFLIVIMLCLLVAGIRLWQSYHSAWLLAGSLLILLSGAVSSLNFFIIVSNAAEIALLYSLLVTVSFISSSSFTQHNKFIHSA